MTTALTSETRRPRSDLNMDLLIVLACLLPMVILPSAIHYWFEDVTSHAIGVAMASTVIIGLLAHQARLRRAVLPFTLVAVLIPAHLLAASLFFEIEVSRASLSLLLLLFASTASLALASWLFQVPDKQLDMALGVVRALLIAVGIFAILEIQPPMSDNVVKPNFPFTEPSHYALVFIPLVLDACVRSRGWRRYMWIALGFAFAYLIKSLALVVGMAIISLISLPATRLIPLALVASASIAYLEVDYFAERLDFGAQSQNVSSLVYIQGWELALSSLQFTSGWGIGFQQLGTAPFESPAADALFRITRLEYNILDGSFIAAKITSEFGLFGVAGIVLYCLASLWAAIRLRRTAAGKTPMSAGERLALAFVTAYAIDMFVRGGGYFTASTSLFMAAIFYLTVFRKAAVGPVAARRPRLEPSRGLSR